MTAAHATKERSDHVTAKRALFVKLGTGGAWEQECIDRSYIKIGYHDVDHRDCKTGDWERVRKTYTDILKFKGGVPTYHVTQLKYFYTEDQDTIWFTFFDQCLWWCFSKPEITLHDDGTKTRPVIGRWSNRNVAGGLLLLDTISGSLQKTQGFRGTICTSGEVDYLLNKINATESPELAETRQAVATLTTAVETLVSRLQPKDFEILVDLVFRQSGWQRLGTIGKAQKSIDLDLLMPVTGQRAFVQIKSQATAAEFGRYETEFSKTTGFDHFFFVVHSPFPDLLDVAQTDPRVITGPRIASMVVRSGLIDWLMKKVG